jgi:hypothetical protein
MTPPTITPAQRQVMAANLSLQAPVACFGIGCVMHHHCARYIAADNAPTDGWTRIGTCIRIRTEDQWRSFPFYIEVAQSPEGKQPAEGKQP